jgi:HSP20 family molecular chaperone IbpA
MDYVEVVGATNRDGILTIRLERHIPEAMKPKTIAITYES